MTHKIYATGYTGKTVDQLASIASKLGAIVVDIRYSPYSRNPEWNRNNLMRILGSGYIHCQPLGNSNYKNGDEIIISDYERGREIVKRLDSPVLLLCMCKSPKGCHRTDVLAMFAMDGFEVEEYTEKPDEPDNKPVQIGFLW